MQDALRLDYKAFVARTAKLGDLRFGMSSVLVPVQGTQVKKAKREGTCMNGWRLTAHR